MATRLAKLASELRFDFNALSNQGKSFLTHEQSMLKEACEASFYTFVKHAWIHLQGRPYIDGWHVGAIAEHFQAVYNLEIRKLLFNSPPRVGKSLLLCSALPAWIWAIDPGFRFLYTSYAQKLTTRDSTACRQLISSHWYQSLWGNVYSLSKDTNSKLRFDTDKRGSRISSSVGGTITGEGGDVGVCFVPVTSIQTDQGLINIGDIVDQKLDVNIASYNHESKLIEYKPIIEYMKSQSEEILTIEFEDGTTIECTPDHPIYVEGKGYIKATDLSEADLCLALQ